MLYGTVTGGGAFNGGAIFQINKDGSNYSILVNLGLDLNDGRLPTYGLTLDSNGVFYGTTAYGATGGTVFRLQLN